MNFSCLYMLNKDDGYTEKCTAVNRMTCKLYFQILTICAVQTSVKVSVWANNNVQYKRRCISDSLIHILWNSIIGNYWMLADPKYKDPIKERKRTFYNILVRIHLMTLCILNDNHLNEEYHCSHLSYRYINVSFNLQFDKFDICQL